MNDYQTAKVKNFINDRLMSETVYGVIRDSFLKRKGVRDIQTLAAERLAIELLDEAWKELNKLMNKDEESPPVARQVGL